MKLAAIDIGTNSIHTIIVETTFSAPKNLRSRKVAQLAHKYESDWQQKSHNVKLRLKKFLAPSFKELREKLLCISNTTIFF